MKKLNTIIIDDEPLACKGLLEYISEVDALNNIAVVNNPAEAVKCLKDADLMYLDINMPKISGIEFLQKIPNPPLTIITTAYREYSLQGYELDVVDYLVKPISFPRFLKATAKAIDYFQLLQLKNSKEKKLDLQSYFFVKSNGVLEKIFLHEIIAIEALANYIIIHSGGKKIIAYLTLKQINEFLPAAFFIKVHKSFIVSLSKIDRVEKDDLVLGNLRIPIGMSYKKVVEQEIVEGKILKR